MFQRILVPLDGSARAEQALPAAARVARAFGGTVLLLCVVPPIAGQGKMQGPETYPGGEMDGQLAAADEYLKIVAASEALGGLPTEGHAVFGAPAPALLDAVRTCSADFLVICRHGLSGLAHWGLGSVAHKLVQQCPVPLLLLPDHGRAFVAFEQYPIRALVALDGSPFSTAVLEPAVHFVAGLAQARSQRGTLLFLQVVGLPASYGRFHRQFPSSESTQAQHEAIQQGEQYLATVAQRLMSSDLARYHLTVTTRVVSDPDVARTIAHTAEQELVDVIALSTHGWGGVLHWALGSIMERVVYASSVPLFILRPENL